MYFSTNPFDAATAMAGATQPGSPAAVYVVTENYQHSLVCTHEFQSRVALLGVNGDPAPIGSSASGPVTSGALRSESAHLGSALWPSARAAPAPYRGCQTRAHLAYRGPQRCAIESEHGPVVWCFADILQSQMDPAFGAERSWSPTIDARTVRLPPRS